MTHLDIFGQFRPFAIGFDRYFEDLERMSNISQTNYPPYNVVKVDEEHFAVELAVAGYIHLESKKFGRFLPIRALTSQTRWHYE